MFYRKLVLLFSFSKPLSEGKQNFALYFIVDRSRKKTLSYRQKLNRSKKERYNNLRVPLKVAFPSLSYEEYGVDIYWGLFEKSVA